MDGIRRSWYLIIDKICSVLNIDLYTHVLDWGIFKNMQLAFLKASTSAFEIPSDHAICAILYSQANKKIIKEKLAWSDYGRKNCESEYTKIFQEYILPIKECKNNI
ncbi:MAG TPA: hypothetical protein PK746_04050 [Spirochaetales bacterium]|nr:hypothetical protein [Spirochaetales bacterium]